MSMSEDIPKQVKYLEFNHDEELRLLDEDRQKFLHDDVTDVEVARTERDIEIARNMKREGFGVDVITKMTDLPNEVIERLD